MQDLIDLPSPMPECSPTPANNTNFVENPIVFQQAQLPQVNYTSTLFFLLFF